MTAKKGFMPEPWNEKCEKWRFYDSWDEKCREEWADGSKMYRTAWYLNQCTVSNKIPPIDLSADEQHIYNRVRDLGVASYRLHNVLRFAIRTRYTNKHWVYEVEGKLICSRCDKCLIE